MYDLINKVVIPAERAYKDYEAKEAAYEASKQENVDIVKRAKGEKLKVAQEKQEALIADFTKAKKFVSSSYMGVAENTQKAFPKLFKNVYITFNTFFKGGRAFSKDMKSYINRNEKRAASDSCSDLQMRGLSDAVTDLLEKEMQHNAVIKEFSCFLGDLKKETEDMKPFSTIGTLLKHVTEIETSSTRLIHELFLATTDKIVSVEDIATVFIMNVKKKKA